MITFIFSVFLSAFLLFQIQPMIGKVILPWFGGTPAVWSAVMLFFQVLLTGGYAYAYWLMEKPRGARQRYIHIALLAFAFLSLTLSAFSWRSPITPSMDWRPSTTDFPVFHIFILLLVSVGLPYFVLASNGPLMQAWFSRVYPERSYARLYALSNFGSLLGLLTYPTLMEPFFPLGAQGWIWSGCFAVFAVTTIWIALQRADDKLASVPRSDSSPSPQPDFSLRFLWVALSGAASLFLLSITNQISQEVAVIPFLWVLPLTIYLLSFILTFSDARWYNRKLYAVLLIVSMLAALWVMLNTTTLHIYWQILAYCFLLFAACMMCHGELYLLRPDAQRLTSFYLMVSLGGAFGGIFVNLIAPFIFNGYWEFMVALALAIALLLTVLPRGRAENHAARARFMFNVFLMVTAAFSIISALSTGIVSFSKRNFYGVIRVREIVMEDTQEKAYVMSHGVTIHGIQYIAADKRDTPTVYFMKGSGIQYAITNHPRYGKGMRVGALGLGVGVIAAYGQPGDTYRYYEINPIAIDIAQGQGGYFSFLSDSKADVSVVLGDARISLEQELARGEKQNFDLLILDVFSSDAIPAHLATKEAFAVYLEHLAPDGMIAAHITNNHLDLQPVFWQLAKYYGLAITRIDRDSSGPDGYTSHWMLLARDPALLNAPDIRSHSIPLDGYTTNIRLWTDDYSNLFQILK